MANTAMASVARRTRTRNRIIFILPLVLAAGFLCLKLARPKTYMMIVQEDHVFEYLQGVLYLIASGLALITVLRIHRIGGTVTTVIYLGFAVALLLTSLEEISWGQRLFRINSPGFFYMNNNQHEINFHNLSPIKPLLHTLYILAGCYGAFAWIAILLKKGDFHKWGHLPLPPRTLMFCFVQLSACCAACHIANPRNPCRWRWLLTRPQAFSPPTGWNLQGRPQGVREIRQQPHLPGQSRRA